MDEAGAFLLYCFLSFYIFFTIKEKDAVHPGFFGFCINREWVVAPKYHICIFARTVAISTNGIIRRTGKADNRSIIIPQLLQFSEPCVCASFQLERTCDNIKRVVLHAGHRCFPGRRVNIANRIFIDFNTTDLPTTAADMAILMEAISSGRGVSVEARADMRGLLLDQKTRFGIPEGLPARIAVGNKTGTWEGATHDIAFVDAPGGTYVIAILSDKGWDWAPLVRLSRAIYAALLVVG